MTKTPVIWWVRRDLRLADNPALAVAAAQGPVIPVFILDPETEGLGAAPLWRLGLGLGHFAGVLRGRDSRLILRQGPALETLRALVAETGARQIVWNRWYEPAALRRDKAVKAALREDGLTVESHNSHLLFEPWQVETGQGGYYKVYSPFWRAVAGRDLPGAQAAPSRIPHPADWPASERLEDWALGARMNRGAEIVAQHVCVGEERARDRLDAFIADRVQDYREGRDHPARPATSGLSENLTYGEISPRLIWQAALRAGEGATAGVEHFRKELVWREFAYHLLYHTPHITDRNWREEWNAFGWRRDNSDARRWRQGMTGEPFVDAAMRELFVTGRVHNRARMIAASYLTKHLLTDWRVGLRWYEDCLIDWDPASNALGWQWVAGSGPDAAPYFRIFNPETQAQKFDPQSRYIHRFVAELAVEQGAEPGAEARAFFDAAPRRWNLSPDQNYPEPVIPLREGRERALAAYGHRNA
ncbi:cryptochrome/photolyase family protein [Halodurantibacterium flavum]|uniref:Cryptochrome/photolyase family protein n=1 Tax=Halodurantibacterium flavum TaxID=1382802 RepID=A0ABW4SBI0_9RHOB